MVYLDYSATTPVNDEVIESYSKACKYIGNPNSLHRLGLESKKVIDAATSQIASIFKVKPSEIIYTSGASEANNTVNTEEAIKNYTDNTITMVDNTKSGKAKETKGLFDFLKKK